LCGVRVFLARKFLVLASLRSQVPAQEASLAKVGIQPWLNIRVVLGYFMI